MIKVDMTLDNDLLFQLQSQLNAFSGGNGGKAFPGTKAAFNMAANLIQKSWQNWAMGGSLEGAADITNPNSKLASSISLNRISDFDIAIGTNSAYMERIQQGSPEYDMKTTYPYGRKSRVSKKDKVPYLIIPFRWGTAQKNGANRAHFGNTIPLEAAKIIQSKKFARSSKTEEIKIEPNAKGEPIERASYDWGDRLNDEDLGNANGMVKMLDESGKRPRSTYFTFRIISAKSPQDAWIRKAKPANDVVGAVERSTRNKVNQIIEEGLKSDLGFE